MPRYLTALLRTRPLSTDVGLLVLRVGVGGSMLLFHGWGKITGGPERWSGLGTNMAHFGIDFWPTFWGFMAALSESVCAALLIVGLLTRPAAVLLGFTMVVASVRHLSLPPEAENAGWAGASHALEFLAVCACLLLTGPGRLSIAGAFGRRSAGRGAADAEATPEA